jgi:phytoene desaturase
MSHDAYDVAVVGAGVGGLAAAIHLGARGRRVLVCEAGARIGGKLDLVATAGFRFDTGPSLLTMPDVLRDLLAAGGLRLEDELDLVPLAPLCRYRFADGTRFDASADPAQMRAAIAALSPRDVAGYERFMRLGKNLWRLTAAPFLFNPLEHLGRALRGVLAQGSGPADLVRLAIPQTLDGVVSRHFRDPRLVQLFDRYATYNGSSPYRTSGVYALIPYVEHAGGAWYPRGGMYAIAEALGRAAARVGVVVRLGAPVRQILVAGGRAAGVELADGTAIAARCVISNADAVVTLGSLLPAGAGGAPAARAAARLEPSSSGFVLLLGVDCRYEQLAHHNIFFSADYRREFADLWVRQVPPADPTIYVCASSRTDPTQAPAGHENLFVLVNAPALGPAYAWEAHAAAYRDLVLDRLEALGMTDLRRHIVFEQVRTPHDFERLYGAWRGSIYGASSNGLLAPFRRPRNRVTGVSGLYLAGGSAHPGGGLPLAMLSGTIAARLALEDLGA